MQQPLLQIRDMAVTYTLDAARHIPVIEDFNLAIAAGEAVGILGESGCGKTTLGLSLLGLLPAAGRVVKGAAFFQGTDLLALKERALRRVRGARISMIYQEPGMALNPVMRVGDQIAEVLCAHTTLSRSKARAEAKVLLAQVGFAADMSVDQAYPHQLSGGQLQRVVIAQAIACRPALLIADEPTTALDAVTQNEILTLLKTLQAERQIALLLISHDPNVFEQFVDRVVVMYAGRVVEEGPTQPVIANPCHPYTQGLLRTNRTRGLTENHKTPLAVIPGEPPNLGGLSKGCSFAPRCPDQRSVCQTRVPEEFHSEQARRVACFNYAR